MSPDFIFSSKRFNMNEQRIESNHFRTGYFCFQAYVNRIQPALLRTSPRSCTLYVETESNLAYCVVTCSKHVPVPSQTGIAKFVGYWSHPKPFPYLSIRFTIKSCYACHPPQHFHFHYVEAALDFFGGRPALSSVQSNRSYDCPIDLRLQSLRYFSVAKYAGGRTPLRPCAAYSSVHLAAKVSIAGYC
ncbi:unnamed protein product [Nippostrongylus brasiliensis]|uniref:Uncharacterized protein n=1 Tax=Nippostrongylus brasiliensis TaxID=27835 RepID=A0A0N4YPE6_NIPBR|nr:unnamed protein product [Nippostrongylus brasiliensis]